MPTKQIDITVPRPFGMQRRLLNSSRRRIVICAGRRGGKTVAAALKSVDAFLNGERVLLSSSTQEQADAFWEYISDWLDAACMTGALYRNKSRRIIRNETGPGRIRVKTAFKAKHLRGDYGSLVVLDEAALMGESVWGDVVQPMLLDTDGTAWIISTPPRHDTENNWFTKLYRDAEARDEWGQVHWPSHRNPHLSDVALSRLEQEMSETSYKREILAQFVAAEGALWSYSDIQRVATAPPLDRVVVGVDPAGGGPDEVGIVAAGKSGDRAYILQDASTKDKPLGWAERVLATYEEHEGDRIVAEPNFGGEMVRTVIQTADANAPVKLVRASRGKQQRAEPVASLYQQDRIYHVGKHRKLETQMTTWDPAESTDSPDRADALVFAITELMDLNNRSNFFVY